MSQTTLASVSIDLIANNASFIQGLSKAEASLKNSVKSMGSTISGLGDAISKTLGPLGGSIGAELSGIFSGVGSAVSEMASKISAAKGITGGLSIAMGGLAAVGIAATASLSGLALSGGELAESLALTSQKTGLSVRDLQTWQAAGNTVGVSLEAITTAMRKFSQAIVGTGKGGAQLDGVLKSLGVTSRDSNEALLQVADAFQKMPDGPIKSAMAVQLFGRSGLDLIPLLDKGRSGLQEFSDIVDQFGPVVDGKAVASMERWKTSTEKLSLAWDSFKVSLSGGVGILASVVDHIAKATKGMSDMLAVMSKHPKDALAGLVTGNIGLAFSHVTASDLPQQQDDSKQRAAIATQDALIAKYKEKYEVLKAGGQAEYALAQQELAIQGAVEAGNFQQAAALQAQIPALKQAVVEEQKRLAAAKELLDVMTRQSAGKIHVSNPGRSEAVVAAPNIQTTAQQFQEVGESLQKLTNAGGVTNDMLEVGQKAIAEFYDEWDKDSKHTIDQINQRYEDQLNHFQGLMALGYISEQQFSKLSVDLATQRVAQIQKEQEKLGGSFAVSFASMFGQIADQSTQLAKHMADDIGGALNDLTTQVAQFATTGRANFAQIGKSLEGNLVKTGANALLGSATSHIAGVFGVKLGKPSGSSSDPIYTKSADGLTDHVKSLGQKLNLGNIGKDFSSAFKGITGLFSKLFSGGGGGFGSILGSLGGLFGGFRADGGSVSPGLSYIVGEKGRERFVPATAGTIMPNTSSSSGGSNSRPIQVNAHFHGVTDADTFKASKSQILGHLANAVGRAVSRR